MSPEFGMAAVLERAKGVIKNKAQKTLEVAAVAAAAAVAIETTACTRTIREIIKIDVPVTHPLPTIYLDCPPGTTSENILVPFNDGLLAKCKGDLVGMANKLTQERINQGMQDINEAIIQIVSCREVNGGGIECQNVLAIQNNAHGNPKNSYLDVGKIAKMTGIDSIPLQPGAQDITLHGQIKNLIVTGVTGVTAAIKTVPLNHKGLEQTTTVTLKVFPNAEKKNDETPLLKGYKDGVAFSIQLQIPSKKIPGKTKEGVVSEHTP